MAPPSGMVWVVLASLMVLTSQYGAFGACPFASLGLRERRTLQSVDDFDSQVEISQRRALLDFDLKAVQGLAAANWEPVKVGA